MMYVLNLTCHRDLELSRLMRDTFIQQFRIEAVDFRIINTDKEVDFVGYENGAGWKATMMKMKEIRKIANKMTVHDWILSVDSDVVFCNPEIFNLWNALRHSVGIIGTQHRQPFPTYYGTWGHMSGCLIFLRGDIVKRISQLDSAELYMIRYEHFKQFNITENEDVILSYLAKYVGSMSFDLGEAPWLTSGNFEQDVIDRDLKVMKSFYHLNYCPDTFLGEPMGGAKWKIPNVLRMKGIEL